MATEKSDPKGAPPPRALNPVTTTQARAHLECTGGPEKGKTFRVAPGVSMMGRDASCDVALTETAISRQHARIERRAEEWVLKNLSANGTLLNKKSVDEAALADGDEIRLGAKTRLKFVVEAVATLTSGRPQFRRRIGTEDEAAEETNPEAEGDPRSLFQRRRSLFIGLGVYLLGVLAVAAYLALGGGGVTGSGEVPILAVEDMIRPSPGARAMRFVRESPEGVWVEGPIGEPVLVPYDDLRSGKAVRITGIRRALDVKFTLEPNTSMASRYKAEAIEMYRIWRLPGKEGQLYRAVRLFQKAMACYGTGDYFKDDPAADKIYHQALKELIDEVQRDYSDAIVNEKSGEYKKAWQKYQRIVRLLPDRDNPIFTNVNRRMTALRQSLKSDQV